MRDSYANWRSAALRRGGGECLAVLANFEAEDSWNQGASGLPAIAGAAKNGVVRRLEELGLWLAREDDTVLITEPPDSAFEDYLRTTELFSGTVISCQTEPASESSAGGRAFPRAKMTALARQNAVLVPMGNTHETQAIASAAGINVSSPSVEICAMVNPKSFSQALCQRLEVPRPLSVATKNLAELRSGLRMLLAVVPRVCVKESLGVSGRGIVIIDSLKMADRLLRMLAKSHSDRDPIDFVVEEWIENAADVNYQLLIDENGSVALLGIRSAQVISGVHQGHRTPSGISSHAASVLEQHGRRICEALRDEYGYFGVVGIDALITGSGIVFPCLEINARLNMSTLQNRIVDEYVGPTGAARFTYMRLSRDAPVEFEWIHQRIEDILFRPGDASGVIVMSHATIRESIDRRLYLATIGRDHEEVEKYRSLTAGRLSST